VADTIGQARKKIAEEIEDEKALKAAQARLMNVSLESYKHLDSGRLQELSNAVLSQVRAYKDWVTAQSHLSRDSSKLTESEVNMDGFQFHNNNNKSMNSHNKDKVYENNDCVDKDRT